MVLYHLSTDLKHDGCLVPRIPERRRDDECDKVERVCFSSTVEGCFTAIPDGGLGMKKLIFNHSGTFLLFVVDTEKYQISQDNLITDTVLYAREDVWDADETAEHWVLQPVNVLPEDRKVVRIKNWSEEDYDITPCFIMELADEKYGGDYLRAYTDTFGAGTCEAAIKIKDLEYEIIG